MSTSLSLLEPDPLLCVLAQEWVAYAQTKTARHKLAKFLKDHADLLDSGTHPDMTSREASSGLQQASEASSTSNWAAAKEEAESQASRFHTCLLESFADL